jgi:hypothetical protein
VAGIGSEVGTGDGVGIVKT